MQDSLSSGASGGFFGILPADGLLQDFFGGLSEVAKMISRLFQDCFHVSGISAGFFILQDPFGIFWFSGRILKIQDPFEYFNRIL